MKKHNVKYTITTIHTEDFGEWDAKTPEEMLKKIKEEIETDCSFLLNDLQLFSIHIELTKEPTDGKDIVGPK